MAFSMAHQDLLWHACFRKRFAVFIQKMYIRAAIVATRARAGTQDEGHRLGAEG